MARHRNGFQSVHSEGGLLPHDLLRRIVDPMAKVPGTGPEDYHLAPGERINENIAECWNRLKKHWREFRALAQHLPDGEPGTGLTNDRWSLPLLRELGFGLLPASPAPKIDGQTYAISRFLGSAPIHLVGCQVSLDRRSVGVRGAAYVNPHGLVQQFLNRSPDHLWGLVSNGLRLRILRDNQALARQSYLEFDLEMMFDGEVYSDFVLLWLMAHATRFAVRNAGGPDDCWLEQWTKEAEEQGTRALGELRQGVERALMTLGQGLVGHPRNAKLREALRSSSDLPLQEFHAELLRVIYRLIFLFVAEDRTLDGLPVLHPRDDSEAGHLARVNYADHYSTARLRELASRVRGSRHGDLWQQFSLITGALSGREEFDVARQRLALPALGSLLWDPVSTKHVNGACIASDGGAELANADFLDSIRYLAFTRQDRVLRPVDYRNLGAEELGGVYESLLSLTPQISGDGSHFTFAEFAGNERKTSGSFYTPDSLVQCLLDSALDPVIESAIRGTTGSAAEEALLSLKICDPAVGSGHFLVGAAHRLAQRLAQIRALTRGESEHSPTEYQQALRDVVGRCLYGVDINPMAAELCRISLWLEALEPGKPLSFLDHHIRVGNSLLGTTPELIARGLPQETFTSIGGDDKRACTVLRNLNRGAREKQGGLFAEAEAKDQRSLEQAAAALATLPDDTIAAIKSKEAAFRQLQQTDDYRLKHLVADTWCAAFVIRKYFRKPGAEHTVSGITQDHLKRLANRRVSENDLGLLREAGRLASQYKFLHWQLAFPEVYSAGGFDVVLGNPPWERVKIQEKEWFAERAPEIANARNAAERKRLISALQDSDPELYHGFLDAQRQAEGESHFLRNSGRYPLCGRGDINLYAVFAELMRTQLSDTGRMGAVLPTGIATDDTTKLFFGDVITRRSLVSLFDFENKGLFPDVDDRMKFCLFTAGNGARPTASFAEFAFFAHAVDDLKDSERRFTLSAEDISLLNPNTRTCPIFRSRRDAELTKAIYRRVPVLIQNEPLEENHWGITFSRMFDMANDSHLFRTNQQLEAEGWQLVGNTFGRGRERYLPLYEAKMMHQLDHRWATYRGTTDVSTALLHEKISPDFGVQPRYWVAESAVFERLSRYGWSHKWLLGFRDITNSTNERTVIASFLPVTAAGHKIPLLLPKSTTSMAAIGGLAANFCAYVFDYACRQKLGATSLAYFILTQLPVLSPVVYDRDCRWVGQTSVPLGHWLAPRWLELVYTSWDIGGIARSMGVQHSPFRWDEERRFAIKCELDAAFFHLYLGTAEEWSKQPEFIQRTLPTPRHAVVHIMNSFPIVRRRDEDTYGYYRTKDFVLEVYDALADAQARGLSYQTRLSPPPGATSRCHPA